MKIVFISDWFAEKMGYSENTLPKAVASLGGEVHLITSNVQPYFNSPLYKEIYEPFIGPAIVGCETKEMDGYILHRLPVGQWRGKLRIKGLLKLIADLRPDIVQTFDALSLTTYEAALAKPFLGYKLFLESHLHASVFPPAFQQRAKTRVYWSVYKATIGRLVNSVTTRCYPISTDCADIVVDFFGLDKQKVTIAPLGVDIDLFGPAASEASRHARQELRQRLGFSTEEIVAIYTGRFSEDKNPLCLAQAIEKLVAQGNPFRGLFVGSGTQKQVEEIRSCSGCVVHPFVPVQDLPPFYRAADIGVWPKQESTSQLDAAASGLPIIVSNKVRVMERVEGNGLIYDEGDPDDLASKLCSLVDLGIRQQMGANGVKKIRDQYSWTRIAEQRMRDYQASL